MADASFRIDYLDSTLVWRNISADVVVEEGIRCQRGILGARPDNVVANPGTLEFTLRNDKGCSGGVAGYYSPGHASVRTDWTFGADVRLVATYSATDYGMWYGRIRTIRPSPGKEGSPRVSVLAQDAMASLAQSTIRALDPQIDEFDLDLLIYLSTQVPSIILGPIGLGAEGSNIDQYPYAFDDIEAGTSGWDAYDRVTRSTFGLLFGTTNDPSIGPSLRFISRHALAAKTTQGSFTDSEILDIDVPSSVADTYNMIRVTTHPKSTDTTSTVVLYEAQSAIEINPRETLTLWGAYNDTASSKKTIGGKEFQTFTSGTDWVANLAADGSGTNVTADVSGTATNYATTTKFVMTNNSYNTVYLTTLQIRGRGIHDDGPVTSEASTGGVERPIEIDMPYQNDPNVGKALADFVLSKVSSLSRQVRSVTFNPHASNTLMLHALQRQIGDVITVTETMTGVTNVDCMIRGVVHEIQPGPILRTTFLLRPALTVQAFILDSATLGKLDTSVLGWA
jgi:hypothetical protein